MVSIDKLTTLCDGTGLSEQAAGSTANLGNIDLGVPTGDPFAGCPTFLVIVMTVAASSTGSATAKFRLVTGTAATPSTTTAEVLLETAVISKADMAAGQVVWVGSVPQGTGAVPILQYLALQQTTGTAAFNGGSVSAFLTDQPYKHVAYPSGQPATPV